MRTEEEQMDEFDCYLNDEYYLVEIVGRKYEASVALKRVDPIAYREMFLAYVDATDWEG